MNIKRIITATALTLAMAATAGAQTEVTDTIADFTDVSTVTIVKSKDGTQTVTIISETAPDRKIDYTYTIAGESGTTTFIDSENPGRWNINKLFPLKRAVPTIAMYRHKPSGAYMPAASFQLATMEQSQADGK